MTETEQQRWLKADQAATELGVPLDTVRRWIRTGRLPAVMPGGTKTGYRIARADLDAFIDARRGTWSAHAAPASAREQG